MEVSRRDLITYGGLGALGAVALGKKAEDRYEVSERVSRATGLMSEEDFVVDQIDDLRNEYSSAAEGRGDIIDRIELLDLFLGNPEYFDGYRQEGFIPDSRNRLDDHPLREAFRQYVLEGVDESSLTPTRASLILDGELEIDLVYLDRGREVDNLVSNGVEAVETGISQVLPNSYDLSVDVRTVEAGVSVDEILNGKSGSPGETIKDLNRELSYGGDRTLPVYIFDPDEVDVLSELVELDFGDLWAGVGIGEGAMVSLPSTLLGISEDGFYSTLVHEIGHSAFELPHSALRDDVMTYNSRAEDVTSFSGVSNVLIESYINSEFEVSEDQRDGKRGIRFRQKPGSIPEDEAVDVFLDNLNTYITDMVDSFDLDMDRFEDIRYQRNNGVDVAQYHDYDGTGVDMEIEVDQLIRSVQTTVS